VTTPRIVLLAALAAFAGCDCGKKKPSATERAPVADEEEPGGRPARDLPPRPVDRDRRPARDLPERARTNASLTVEDATRAMPQLDARSLGAPALSPNGRQVRFTYCIDADDLATAAQSVAAGVERGAWQKVTSRAPGGATSSPRHGIAAEKGDLRLSITVQAIRRTGCDSSVNQFFAVAAMNRLAAAGSATP